MQRSLSLVRTSMVLGLIAMTAVVASAGHAVRQAAAQAAGVGGIAVVSVVADDPADPRFAAPYSYLIDAGTLDGVTPAAAGSETYQLYDDASGDILDTEAIGPDGSVTLTFPGQDVSGDLHVINIADPGNGSGPVGVDSIVTVVVNPGAGTAQPTQPTATVAVTATVAATTAPTADAPDGSRAAIFAGDCDADFSGDPVAELTDITAPAGEEQGAASFAPVQTSFSTLGLPLDDVLAEDHVLVVFDQDDDTVPVICGAVGGVVSDDGSLAFGLPEVGGSGCSGVAYLTPDGDQTQATVFLAEDLSGGDATPTV